MRGEAADIHIADAVGCSRAMQGEIEQAAGACDRDPALTGGAGDADQGIGQPRPLSICDVSNNGSPTTPLYEPDRKRM